MTDDSTPNMPWHLVRWDQAQSLALPPRSTDDERTEAFGLHSLQLAPARSGTWIGARAHGASVNAYDAHFSIHSAGTHTESAAHVSDLPLSIADVAPLELLCACILECAPTRIGNDHVITRERIEHAWQQTTAWPKAFPPLRAAIVRTRDPDETPHRRWSNTHPPFFLPEALSFLVEQGIEHLICDLPSVDPEQDGGKLAAHRTFFALEDEGHARTQRTTITELAWIPASIPSDLGLVRLDVLDWPTDASPSRPVFYPLILPP